MKTAALRVVQRSGAAGETPPPLIPPAPPATPRAEPPSGAPRARRGGTRRRAAMVRSVVAEIEALRPVVHEAVQQYELRIIAQLAEIQRALLGESAALARLPPVKTTSAMLRAIRHVELKPARGRPKDLVRLHELVAELTELLTPGS